MGTSREHTSHRISHTLGSHEGVMVPNMHFEVSLCSSIICPNPFLPSTDQFINHRLHEHTHIIPRVFRNYQRQEYVLSLKDDAGGRLRGITNMGQQVCGAGIIPYGLNPSDASATRTLRASRAFSRWIPSKWVHASPSDGCTSFSGLYQQPFLCHIICFMVSSVMYSCWILGMNGRHRRIFTGIVSCLFWPSPESTSRNLEDQHFAQYFASACSFLIRCTP
jgi:hypothetical protein